MIGHQKWIGFIRNKVAGRAGQIAIAQSLSTLLLFLVDILFARIFSVELFGSWKQILLISNFLIPIASLGLIDGFKYFAAKDREIWKEHYSRVLFSLSLLSILVLFFFFALKHFIFVDTLNNPDLLKIWWVFPLIYFTYSAATLSRFAAINANAETKFLRAMVLSLIVNIGFYAGVWWFQADLSGFQILVLLAASLFSGHLIRHLYLSTSLASITRFPWKSFFLRMKEYFQYGVPLYLTSFLTLIILNTDKTVVSIFAGVTGFAIYSVGAKEVPFLSILSSSVYQSTFPSLVEAYTTGQKHKAIDIWLNATSKVSAITYPLVVILMIVASPVITWLYGVEYQGAVQVFQAYLFLIFWRNNYYGALLSASGKTVWIMSYGLISVVLNIGLSVLFYKLSGPIGVVWGTLITVTFVNIAQMVHEGVFLSFVQLYVKKPLYLIYVVAAVFFFFTANAWFE